MFSRAHALRAWLACMACRQLAQRSLVSTAFIVRLHVQRDGIVAGHAAQWIAPSQDGKGTGVRMATTHIPIPIHMKPQAPFAYRTGGIFLGRGAPLPGV